MTSTAPLRGATAEDVRLARIHLRMGQLTLARAELEDLARRDALDTTGLAVLAEARWRTGDAPGAAAAADLHFEAGGNDPVAVCIAAETAAAEGRPDDARACMDRLPNADAATLDALFAGMPRRAFWPAAPVDHAQAEEIRRDASQAGRPASGPQVSAAPAGEHEGGTSGATPSDAAAGAAPQQTRYGPRATVPGPREVLESSGAWSDIAAQVRPGGASGIGTPAARGSGRRQRGALDPQAELERARTELDTKPDRALLRLGLVLRHDPTLAPAVLEAIHLRREPAATLLRGDAERLLGRHLEAEAAFDAVAESLEA